MDEIKLCPCPLCGGLPLMMIEGGWPHPQVHVQCSACGTIGPIVYYSPEGDRVYRGFDRILLPSLPRARREAAAAWADMAINVELGGCV